MDEYYEYEFLNLYIFWRRHTVVKSTTNIPKAPTTCQFSALCILFDKANGNQCLNKTQKRAGLSVIWALEIVCVCGGGGCRTSSRGEKGTSYLTGGRTPSLFSTKCCHKVAEKHILALYVVFKRRSKIELYYVCSFIIMHVTFKIVF